MAPGPDLHANKQRHSHRHAHQHQHEHLNRYIDPHHNAQRYCHSYANSHAQLHTHTDSYIDGYAQTHKNKHAGPSHGYCRPIGNAQPHSLAAYARVRSAAFFCTLNTSWILDFVCLDKPRQPARASIDPWPY